MDSDFRLAQLRAFAEVARWQSYTRAAEELAYSQPGIYLQVKALEKTLGVRLFERRGRDKDVTLTDEAVALFPHITELLLKAKALYRTVEELQGHPMVRIGAGRHTGPYLLMPLLREYSARHPDDKIELHILGPQELIAGLEAGDLDLVAAGTLPHYLDAQRRRNEGLLIIPWMREQWVVVESLEQPMEPSAVPIVFLPPYFAHTRRSMERYLADALSGPCELMVLETADAVRSAMENGLGMAVLPRTAVQPYLDQQTVRITLDPGTRTRASVDLFHRRPRVLTPAARRFLRFAIANRRKRRGPKENDHGASSSSGQVLCNLPFQQLDLGCD